MKNYLVTEDNLRRLLQMSYRYQALMRNPAELYRNGAAGSYQRYVEDYNQLHYSDFQSIDDIVNSVIPLLGEEVW